MIEAIEKLFFYDDWANSRVLESLRSAPEHNQKALRLLAHLLISEKIWIMRLKDEDTSAVNKSPELSLEECESLAEEMRTAYADYLGSLGEEGLSSIVTYRNFRGDEFKTPAAEILTHVAMHGTYHRGQMATAMRAEGHTPADTDFITFARTVGAA